MLARCLASLSSQVAEPGQVEVLVVDNGSTDGTADLLGEWQRGDADRRVVAEPRRGLVHARNAALEASDRDVVIFADDDALTPPAWARAHLVAYQDPSVGAAGGPVGLIWPESRPTWVTDAMSSWYGALDLGDEPGPFPGTHGPYGVNMSVRRAAALAVGGYDPCLGHKGNKLLAGEEPDMTRRLVEAGWGIVYVPAAALVHQVSPERVLRRWVLRRGWAQGVTNARLEVLADRHSARHLLRRAAAELTDAPRRWRPRRSGGDQQVFDAARAAAAVGAGLEFVRLTVAHPERAGR